MRAHLAKFPHLYLTKFMFVILNLAFGLFFSACRLSPHPSPGLQPLPSSSPTQRALPTLTPTALKPVKSPTLSPAQTDSAPSPTSTPTPTPLELKISILNAAEIEQQAVINFSPWDLVTSLAWSPNGKLLAAAAGESIYLYAASPLQPLSTFHTGALTHGLAFSPDSRLLAAGSHDGVVRVWNLTGNPIAVEPILALEAHKKGANCVAFSPDGRMLASGGNDAVVRVWDLNSGQRVQQIIGGSYAIPNIAFTRDGSSLAIANGPLVRLRDVESGRIVDTYRVEALVENGVWTYPTLYSLTYSPDGRFLAAGDHLNQVHIWDIQSQDKPIVPLTFARQADSSQASPMTLAWDLTYSPDGGLLLSASGAGIRIWDATSGKLLMVLDDNAGVVTSLAFNPSGSILVSGGLDAALRFWTVKP
jgi:WD40 repeat protein